PQPPDPEQGCRRLRCPVRARRGDRVDLRGAARHARAPGGPGGDPRVLAPCHGVAATTERLRGGRALPDPGPGGGDHGDAGEGDRDHDGPTIHDDVRPDPPHPGRSYCALPRLRRSPDPGRRDRGTAPGKLTWIPGAGTTLLTVKQTARSLGTRERTGTSGCRVSQAPGPVGCQGGPARSVGGSGRSSAP